jgi:dihydroorotate dehydrogenase
MMSLRRSVSYGWFWLTLMGVGLIVCGALAWLIAAFRVVLPYDEVFAGLTLGQLNSFNPRLLPFMAHDRVAFAGTLISVGVLYVALAVFGVRAGEVWARRALLFSASVGFLTFLLFLGFGYLDPAHALGTGVLLVFFILGVTLKPSETWPAVSKAPTSSAEPLWSAGRMGQIFFVLIGVGIALAGLTIAFFGATSVFVPEDLQFLGTTPRILHAFNAHLIPLIAHDRASMGGGLVADGVGVALAALWGYRRGARWVWLMFVGAGLPGFVGTLGVHFATGYVNLWHLFPGFVALAIYIPGLIATYPYLCDPGDGVTPRRSTSAFASPILGASSH